MMKKSLYLIATIVAMLCIPTSKVAAQNADSDFWMQYALDKTALEKKIKTHTDDPNTVKNYTYDLYLYCPEDNVFMNCDGEYGTQAIEYMRGFGLTVEKLTSGRNTYYYIRTAIMRENKSGNLANFLGTDKSDNSTIIYFDRDGGRTGSSEDLDVRWQVVSINDKMFQLVLTQEATNWWDDNKTLYLTHDAKAGEFKLSSNKNDATNFAFLDADSYHQAILDQKIQKELNVTGLVLNSRFGRNVKTSMWGFYDMNSQPVTDGIGYSIAMDMAFGTTDADDTYARIYGKYGSAEIDEGTSGFYRQQVTGLKPGLYKVKARCVYYPTNGENSSAFLFAKNNGTLITPLSAEAQSDFHKNYVLNHEAQISDLSYGKEAFRWNVPAAEYMDKNAQTCEFEVYATVTKEDPTLGFGIAKREKDGYVFLDEIELYYYGDYEFGMDAYNTDMNKVDENAYEVPRRYNLRRNFNTEPDEKGIYPWNALILPVDLTSGVIMGAFGEDVKVTRLAGINPENPSQILFEPVKLAEGEGIKAGECYLLQVKKAPNVGTTEKYSFTIITDNATEGTTSTLVEADGPIYHIDGVTRAQEFAPKEFTGSHGSGKLQLNYKGYFYHNPEGAPAGSYIMSGGKMYHLTKTHYLSGSYWYLTVPNESPNVSKTFVIMDEGQSTDINGIVTEKTTTVQEGVYNLNGQKVADGTSLKGLPKGIYVVNGKKYVVK